MAKNHNAKGQPTNVVKQDVNELAPPPPKPADAMTAEEKAAAKAAKKAAKVKRAKYPVPEGGLIEWPTDYDSKKHAPLARAAFKNEDVWLDRKATSLETAAKKLREEAEQVRKLGPNAGGGKSKKLMKVQAEHDALIAAMKAAGLDVDALIAAAKANAEAAA